MNKADVQMVRDKIVFSALVNIPFDGWRWDVIERSAKDAEYSADMARAVFPLGLPDVLSHFSDLADREMLRLLSDVDAQQLRVRERIAAAVMARFHFLSLHKESERLALQFWMRPSRKLRALKNIWRSADVIWRWAGDEARDYNRYTKRGLLSGVMASTVLVFLNDDSETLEKTKAFLDRRIENVLQLGKIAGKFSRKV